MRQVESPAIGLVGYRVFLGTIAAIPLISSHAFLQPTTPLRFLFTCGAAALGLFALFVHHPRYPLSPPIRWAILVCTLSAVASAILAADPRLSLVGDPQRRMGVLSWLAAGIVFVGFATYVKLTQRPQEFFLVVAAIALIQAPFAVAQALGANPLSLMAGSSRSVGTLGNPALLAELSLLTALSSRIARRGSRRVVYRWMWAAEGCSWLCLVLSGTRSTLAIAALATLGVTLFAGARGNGADHPPWRSLAAPVLGSFGGLALTFSDLGSLFGRSRGAFSTGVGRIDTWKISLSSITDKPFFGWGDEHFVSAFPRHITAEWEQTYSRARIPDRAHNIVLDLAVTRGLLGIISGSALLFVTAHLIRKHRSDWQGSEHKATIEMTILSLGAVFLNQLFFFPTIETLAIIAAFAAIPAALATTTEPASDETPTQIPAVQFLRGIALISTLVVISYVPLQAARADLLARNATDLSTPADDAARDLSHASELAPESGFYLTYQIASATAARRVDLAAQAANSLRQKAQSVRDNPYLWLQLAKFQLDEANQLRGCDGVHDSISALREVLRVDNNSAEGWFLLGNAHRLLGDDGTAVEMWMKADELFARFEAARQNIESAKAQPSSAFIPQCANGDAAHPPINSRVLPGEIRGVRTDPQLALTPMSVTIDESLSSESATPLWEDLRGALDDPRFLPFRWQRLDTGRVELTISFVTPENFNTACPQKQIRVDGVCGIGRVIVINHMVWTTPAKGFAGVDEWHGYLAELAINLGRGKAGTGCEIMSTSGTADLARCADSPWRWSTGR